MTLLLRPTNVLPLLLFLFCKLQVQLIYFCLLLDESILYNLLKQDCFLCCKGTTDITTSKTSEGSSLIPMEATLAPQKSPSYVVIGCSAVGGALVLLIIALIMRKIVSRTKKVTPVLSVNDHQQEFAIQDERLPGHFQMLPLPGKM